MRRLLGVCLLWFSTLAVAQEQARVAIIIDDIGNDYRAAKQVLALPLGVTTAILPRLPYSRRVALQAHRQGREVMLHQPMASEQHRYLGPGGLGLVNNTDADIDALLAINLRSVPYAAGINNHMGSLLTSDAPSMRRFMQVLKQHGNLFFIDSRTNNATVAQTTAEQYGLKTARRDVFLDNVQDEDYIRNQLQHVLQLARQRGSVIAIGHPHPQTLAVLREVLPQWQQQGVVLLPASQVIAYQRSPESWHASSSHSPKVAKNSKR